MRLNPHTPANRTTNTSAFHPAITVRILSKVLLVIILRIGNSYENCGVTSASMRIRSALTTIPRETSDEVMSPRPQPRQSSPGMIRRIN
jgi:hypothetical protein